MATRQLFGFVIFMALWAGLVPVSAQEAITRTELRRTDLTGSPASEVVMTVLEARPGAMMPRHIHHGDEFLYVLQTGTIQAPGQPPMRLETGASLHFAREVPHGGFTVVGEDAVKVLTVHIVDKNRPLTELVP
jgi:quercetin dioxygenase-like cupin family protein